MTFDSFTDGGIGCEMEPMTDPTKFAEILLRHLLGLLVVGAMAISACGDDGESADATTTVPAATSSLASSTSAPTGSESSTTSTSAADSTTIDPTDTSGDNTTNQGGLTGPTVEVYFGVATSSNCGDVQAHPRRLDDDFEIHRQTFLQLVAGPTSSEAADGASSFFSSETADVVKSAILTDGLLTVDFTDLRPLIPNASTSCGSEALLAQLNNTAFQFDAVERTRYLLDGSCTDFGNWLQRECFDSDRAGRQLDVSTNEQASGAGCTPASTDTLPPGRWFGYVTEAQPEQLSFDLACWFEGAAAAAAAAEDGEESPPPNDYYIRNDSSRLRIHVVESNVEVVWLRDPGDPATTTTTQYTSWIVDRGSRPFNPGVWITTTDDSHVVKIEEQYVP